MWKPSLTALCLGSLALAGPPNNPQNPFPAPPVQTHEGAMWSTFWWADYDGDGALDVLVLHPNAPARLYRNTGDGRFEEMTQPAGLGGVLGARQAIWADFDGDGRLDLFLTVPGPRSRLLRNGAGGTFEDATLGSGLGLEQGVLRAQVLDFDQDGAPDLLLMTPEGERLLRNLGPAIFEETTLGLRPGGLPTGPSMDGERPAPGTLGSDSASGLDHGSRDLKLHPPTPGGPEPISTGGGRSVSFSGSTLGGSTFEASTMLVCASTIDDFANPGVCLEASSDPILGMLYPISSDWFVSSAGRVGLGTTDPLERLQVEGRIRTSGQLISMVAPGTAPFAVSSTTRVTNLNADLLDNLDSSAFRLSAAPIGTADLANGAVTSAKIANGAVGAAQLGSNSVDTLAIVDGTILNADVSPSAAIAGTKIAPNFGLQSVVTSGRGGFGTTGPNSTLHVSSPAGDNALRVQVNGGTKILVSSGGGTSIGTNFPTPPVDGLYVHGNLGVGSLSPVEKLDVQGNINATGNYRQGGSVFLSATGLFFGKDTGWPNLAYNLGTSGLGMGSPSANNLAFQTLGVERLRITNSGRVGIGVTSPGFRLDLPNIASVEGQGRANAWTTYSSRRWKENIQTIHGALELVLRMRGVTFDWTAESGGQKDDIGFIAEEVGALVPQLVSWEEGGEHAQSLKYDRITALAVEAIKEQQDQIESLRDELERQEALRASELAAAELRVGELERALAEQGARLERVMAALASLMENRDPAGGDE